MLYRKIPDTPLCMSGYVGLCQKLPYPLTAGVICERSLMPHGFKNLLLVFENVLIYFDVLVVSFKNFKLLARLSGVCYRLVCGSASFSYLAVT